jgi:hypothetical protein
MYDILEPRFHVGTAGCITACDDCEVVGTSSVDWPRTSANREDSWCFQSTAIVRF